MKYRFEFYVISGGYGQGGTGTLVPSKTWKVLVVLTQGTNDTGWVTTSTCVIAVLMPNDQTCNSQPWGYYRVSVDSIEALTGFNFMSNVSTTIQGTLESKVDSGPTS